MALTSGNKFAGELGRFPCATIETGAGGAVLSQNGYLVGYQFDTVRYSAPLVCGAVVRKYRTIVYIQHTDTRGRGLYRGGLFFRPGVHNTYTLPNKTLGYGTPLAHFVGVSKMVTCATP